ncbi:TPA: endonuclease MutS2 [Campylobacter fetus subsp. venerealis]|uniref:Endonuclease MutS2 n=2 Tax=Campylobacter fetus TaxID=196 RepID=A0AAE6IYC1_CAMFE|nr:endonuclease MutS2 [Campylobacter fetus]OCS21705.1 DNA strand exchange inhibitor protein [Campylobacter fetus subsp. venerealis cfvi97/532]OCS25668.1 DNA strand exchange inhibitor protein [Campylobacter fetus subsp. venerealis cfvB10]OCS29558.1 DNA strand exchange inhibitor protein [Campylobacter fetus subsp. venerealis LMG 6570 = CCUG 33900]AHE93941.1 DNA mismatch binding protein, MutS2 family [Campylobacter fetus subsp. venerealis cfvi03/293]AIR80306.2 DNA mismatch binding protein, MutS2 
MKELFRKLDLNDYLEKFNSLLAREKPLFMSGDSKLNYEKLTEISILNLKSPNRVANLDDALARLAKQGILHISEIYEFVKIIDYFEYLKKLKFENKMQAYLDKIEIPNQISKICSYFDNEGEFKESIDERLVGINAAFKNKKDEINSELKRLIYTKSIVPYLVDTQIHFINDNEALLVRGGFNHVLKGSVIARSSGGYFYVLPANISKLKIEQRDLLDKKDEIIFEHSKTISSIFSKNLMFLKFINSAFDHVDALIARVMMAKLGDLNFVLSDGSSDIVLNEFAHPALKNPKRVSVSFKGKILLITGVNAGGKSMLLKSILSAAILAKYLLPMSINSQHSKIGSFKEFDTIIEDPQSAKNDISTFAGRMLHFSGLFGKKSLLIGIDEIELGTDFEEAASLYSVMIDKLLENDIKMVITTHHKRLAMLLAKHSDVELLAALYDEVNSRPKYEFLAGTIGKSYAFETAVRYGISSNLVALAKKSYGEDKENLNEVISKTINLEMELKIKLHDANLKEERLNSLLQSLKDQKEKADEILRSSLNHLEIEYYKAINEAKRGINLKDIKDKQRSVNKANELVSNIQKPQISLEPLNLKIGDRVKYEKIKGEILSLNKNEVTILSDGLKLRVPINLLKRSGNQPNIPQKNINVKVQKPTNASVVIDLHGLRSEEAIARLDKFISDSLVMGFDEVLIKHGIGTGKLAYAVKEFLKAHPSVKAYKDGTPSEGGFGSKVVKL